MKKILLFCSSILLFISSASYAVDAPMTVTVHNDTNIPVSYKCDNNLCQPGKIPADGRTKIIEYDPAGNTDTAISFDDLSGTTRLQAGYTNNYLSLGEWFVNSADSQFEYMVQFGAASPAGTKFLDYKNVTPGKTVSATFKSNENTIGNIRVIITKLKK